LSGCSIPTAILAFSLFTNDGPRNTPALQDAVRSTAARAGGCAVWATVVRPPLGGVSYDAANTLLRRLANDPELALGLQLVDWAAEVAQSPSLIARDGVHGTPAGYRALAQLYAQAIASCAGAASAG
jgi:lysophospholipase L1-like esterase